MWTKFLNWLGQYWILSIGFILFGIANGLTWINNDIAQYCSIGLFISLGLGTVILTIIALRNEFIDIENKKRKWIIFKGWHFTLHIPKFFIFNRDKEFIITHMISFDSNCLYILDNKYDGVNKLFGLNIGLTKEPHTNSFRFGWNCEDEDNQICIFKYEYIDGVRNYSKFAKLNLSVYYMFELRKTPTQIQYRIYNADKTHILYTAITNYQMSKLRQLGYYCYLYFGGIYPAPHKMIIYH